MIFEDDDADRDQHERDRYIGRNRSHADSPTRSIRQQETHFNTGSGSSHNKDRPVRFPERTNKRFVTRKGEDTDGQNHYACHIGDDGCIEWIDFFRYRFLGQIIKAHPAHSQAQWKIEGCSHRRHVVSPVLNVWETIDSVRSRIENRFETAGSDNSSKEQQSIHELRRNNSNRLGLSCCFGWFRGWFYYSDSPYSFLTSI